MAMHDRLDVRPCPVDFAVNKSLKVDTLPFGLNCGPVEIEFENILRRHKPRRHVASELYDRGHFTRPIGETIQLVPPLSSQKHELDSFVTELLAAISA